MIGRLLLPLRFFFWIGLTMRQLDLAAAASSSKVVTTLPGFDGLLPFNLETGYVEVDEINGTELFYYFVESEAGGDNDPFLLWLTGGDHCSVLSGLALEIGPFQFVVEPYSGTVPRLQVNPYSWTKLASILFVDAPAGAGFSFFKQPEGYDVGDVSTSLQLHEFLNKWFTDHSSFLLNPLYAGGDSYAGKIVPFIAQTISEGIDAGKSPHLNLKGYLVGNPVTGERIDANSRVPYAHGFGIISNQLYENITGHCKGENYRNPTNALCAQLLDKFNRLLSEVRSGHILLNNCGPALTGPVTEMDDSAGAGRKILSEEDGIEMGKRRIGFRPVFLIDGPIHFFYIIEKAKATFQKRKEMGKRLKHPPPSPTVNCQTYGTYLSYFWANDEATREALGIKDGTVEEWVRCRSGDVPYERDISSSLKYHRNVTVNGYRALVYRSVKQYLNWVDRTGAIVLLA